MPKNMTKKKVKPIPEPYHTVTPHLVVDDAKRALEFYGRAFSAEEIVRMPTPDGKIVHAEIRIGDSTSCWRTRCRCQGAPGRRGPWAAPPPA